MNENEPRSEASEERKPPQPIRLSAKVDPSILRSDEKAARAAVRRALLSGQNYATRTACSGDPSFDAAVDARLATARREALNARGPVAFEVVIVPKAPASRVRE